MDPRTRRQVYNEANASLKSKSLEIKQNQESRKREEESKVNLPFLSLASPFLVFQRKPHPQATYSKWPHRLFTLITHQSSPTINFGFSIFCKYSHILIQKLMHEFNKDGQWVMRLEYGRHALLCSLWLEPRE